jgi:voltage-gated potassium channel
MEYKVFYTAFDYFSVAVFSLEYLIRIWIADLMYPNLSKTKARIKYVFSFFGLIDLLAILPFYLPMFVKIDLRFLRMLRLLRIFRILKLARFIKSLQLLFTVFKEKKEELIITMFGSSLLLILSATLMYEIEHDIQPDKFGSIFHSIWWAVATLTTIGYGDVFPISGWGQFLAAITALFGIGLVAIPTGIISIGFVEQLQNKNTELSNSDSEVEPKSVSQFEYCPYCGKKLPEHE